VLAIAGVLGTAERAAAVTAYALTTTNGLVRFDADLPTIVSPVIPISGLQTGESIIAIDFDERSMLLYGVADNGGTGRLYVLNGVTGHAIAVGTSTFTINGTSYGFTQAYGDHTAQLFTNTGQRLFLDLTTGAVSFSTTMLFAIGGLSDAAFLRGDATLFVDTTNDRVYAFDGTSGTSLLGSQLYGMDLSGHVGFDTDFDGGIGVVIFRDANVAKVASYNLDTGDIENVHTLGDGSLLLRDLTLIDANEQTWLLTSLSSLFPSTLFRVDTNGDGAPSNVLPVRGLNEGCNCESLTAIAVRPSTGQLYGLSTLNRLFRIDPTTGHATIVNFQAGWGNLPGSGVGMAFDPVRDQVRVTLPTGENYRLNPDTNAVVGTDTNLSDLAIREIAYTDTFNGPATLYGLKLDDNVEPTWAYIGGIGGTPSADGGGVSAGFPSWAGSLPSNAPTFGGLDIGPVSGRKAFIFSSTIADFSSFSPISNSYLLLRQLDVYGFRGLAIAARGRAEFSSATMTVSEASPPSIQIVRTGDSASLLSVLYQVTGGTATAGVDYTSIGGGLTFLPGETQKTIVLPVLDDSQIEGDETIVLTLSASMPGMPAGSVTTQTVTIHDDDHAAPTLTIATPTGPVFSTSNAAIALSGTASGDPAIASVSWANNRGGSGTATGTTAWTIAALAIQPGPNAITVTTTDTRGSTVSATIVIVREDNATPQAPTLTIAAPTTEGTWTTTMTSIAMSGTAADDQSVASVSWINHRGGSGIATGTTAWNVPAIALQLGANAITVTATDNFGNTGSAVLVITREVNDPLAPTITITAPTAGATFLTTGATITVSGTADDDQTVASVTWTNHRGGSGTATGTTTWTIPSMALELGANAITVVATDTNGRIGSAMLVITRDVDDHLPPTISITAPTTEPSFNTSAATIALSGTAADDHEVATVTWSSHRGDSGTATGTDAWTIPAIALEYGANAITVTATDIHGATGSKTILVMRADGVPTPLTYTLAEGATGAFFSTDILLANPNKVEAPVQISFFTHTGEVITLERILAAESRTTIPVGAVIGLESTEVSTLVSSTLGLPLVVERTMRWDHTKYGAHTEKAVDGPATTWYFAEGSQGFFQTFLLLANAGAVETEASVQFLRENLTPVTKTFTVAAHARRTIDISTIPELANTSFGTIVTFSEPGVAERAMYFGSPVFNGGHESAGATAPATKWYLAEGATGDFFDTFLLIANPNTRDAHVTLTYLPSTGIPISKAYTVGPFGRLTINLELEDAALANAAVATSVDSGVPVVAERAMYWPGHGDTWHEAHNSFGVTEAATRWGLAEGRVGGDEAAQTFILLANTGTSKAQVSITYLRADGAAPITRTYTVPPTSRYTVFVNEAVPELVNEAFGARIESSLPIVVERALYSDSNGVVWAAGTNATGTRLP
jgi:hypothetical protein